MKKPNTVVLIHGLWMTPRCWDPFAQYFQRIGYKVHRPAWPRLDGEPENMRKSPEELAGLGVLEIADHYEKFVRSLPEPPILIGHSFGGLIVQILLDRGLGVAGVAVDATAPKGVYRLPFAQLRAASPVLSNPLNYRRTVMLTLDQFRYAFANTMSEAAARQAYDRDAIPGPGRPIGPGGGVLLRIRHQRLPQPARAGDRRNAWRAPLSRLLERLVEQARGACRNRTRGLTSDCAGSEASCSRGPVAGTRTWSGGLLAVRP